MPGGPGEWILIVVMALIVFGPRRLPELGASVGKAIREFRRATSDLTREFSEPLANGVPSTSGQPALPPPPDSEVYCPSCAAKNLKINKFCGQCGRSMETAVAQGPTADFTCASCGAANRSSSKFCTECGQPIELAAPPDDHVNAATAPEPQEPAITTPKDADY